VQEGACILLELVADSPKDEDLVRSALAGDHGAFDQLVERYAPRMFRMIRAQVGETSLAEDLVQETFLDAFVDLPRFRFGSGFFTWLYRIMINTVAQHRRKTARRLELDARVQRTDLAGDSAEATLERREIRERFWRALADLPEEYRAALFLREWAELSYAEIAQTLGCPVGTVDSRIARARQMLVERLANDEDMR